MPSNAYGALPGMTICPDDYAVASSYAPVLSNVNRTEIVSRQVKPDEEFIWIRFAYAFPGRETCN
jgi:hypothetical protein